MASRFAKKGVEPPFLAPECGDWARSWFNKVANKKEKGRQPSGSRNTSQAGEPKRVEVKVFVAKSLGILWFGKHRIDLGRGLQIACPLRRGRGRGEGIRRRRPG